MDGETPIQEGISETTGIKNGLYATFQTVENEVIEMQVGMSYTSIEHARENLDIETKEKGFDLLKEAAHEEWQNMLGRIEVKGRIEEDKLKFYTGLYHALLGRGISSDAKGTYPTRTGEIGQIPLDENGQPKYHHYNTDVRSLIF